MSPRLGFAMLSAGMLAVLVIAGCSKNAATTPVPTPTPTSSATVAPDTLYVQDATSRTVRAYTGASAINGGALASNIYPTADIANPDVIYGIAANVLWYPDQTNNRISVWTTALTKTNMNPDFTVPLTNQEGAATFDATHNLLIVAQNTSNTVQIYASASTLGQGGNTTPAGTATLTMTDGCAPGTPRPQEMYYDPVHDRLFVSDNGCVVGVFDAFGAGANAAAIAHTNYAATANRQISGLFSPDGLAYNPTTDVLWVAERSHLQVDVLMTASTLNGSASHAQTITNFTGPLGLAYDAVRDLLFVYDAQAVVVLPNATTASGAFNAIPNRRVIFDAQVSLSGFGLFLDTTH
jgi:sugar lactone lactonase YvrE